MEEKNQTDLKEVQPPAFDTTVLDQLLHDPKGWWSWRFVYQFFVISLTWVLFGYDVGIVSGLIGMDKFIIHFQGPPAAGEIPAFTARSLNMTVTVAIVGSICAPLFAPFLSNKIGRKRTINIAFGLFCLPSSFLQLFAPNIAALAIGRFFNYMGITLAEQMVLPYLVEVVPAKYRGMSIAFSGAYNGVFGVIATVIMYFCAKIDTNIQWKIPLAIQIALPFTLLLFSLTLQESTSWLVKKGRIEEARAIMTTLRRKGRDDLVDAELANMIAAVEEERSLAAQGRFLDIFNKQNWRRTLAASWMPPMTACSGLGLTATYGVVILISVGVSDPFTWNVLSSVLSFIGLCVGGVLNDMIGRRTLIQGGLLLVIALDFAAGGIGTTGFKTKQQGLALAGVSIVISFACQVAFSGIYTLQSEVPAVTLREHTIAYTFFWSLAATITSSVALPYIIGAPSSLGPKTYFICGGFMVVALVGSYFIIPETKNRSFAEIDEMYNEGIAPWKMRNYKGRALENISAAANELQQKSDA